jgi:hypothetical protein
MGAERYRKHQRNGYGQLGIGCSQVSITVTDERTNTLVFKTMTDASGQYRAIALKPSDYVIVAELAGFKREVRRGVTLQVNQAAQVDFRMQVGQVSEVVEVTEAAPLMNTQSAELGDVVERRRVVDLPINGRFFVNLVSLTVGVTPPAPVGNPNNNQFLGARAGQPGVEVNGQRPGSNNYTVDGVDNTESTVNSIILYPPVDAIQEFKVQTSNQDLEFGKKTGATINVVIRSGTNQLHGNVYEFLRNSAFDARNYFDRRDVPIPALRLNQYGGTLGGPIKRNKTFAFGYYEGYKVRQAQTYLNTVATPLMRTGNLSELGRAMFDPLTFAPSTGTRQRFANDTIPASRLDVPAQRMLTLNAPLPNRPGVANNFLYNPKRNSNSNGGGIRVDHQFRERDNLFVRFIRQDFRLDDPALLPLPILASPFTRNKSNIEAAPEDLNARGVAVGHTHVFTPQLVNELRLGFTRMTVFFSNPLQGDNVADKVGIPFANNPNVAYSSGLPTFSIAGFTGLGESGIQPFIVADNNYQIANHMTWIRGKHTIKFGGDYIRRQFNFFQSRAQRGGFTFNGQFTSQVGVGNTGSAMGDFLLGYPSASELTVLLSPIGQRQFQGGAYFQDTWKVSRKLTFTYGLRYELYDPRTETGDRQANFDPTTPGGAVVLASESAPCGRALRCTDYKNFAPRMGFAYQVNSKTVVRGGYGFFYDDLAVHGFGGTSGLMYQPPFTWSSNIINSITSPTNRLGDGIPPTISIPVTNGKVLPVRGVLYSTTYQNPYGKNAYVQARNITIENQLTKNMALTASYVSNKGNRLMYRTDLNQPIPGPGDLQARRPFPLWPGIQSMFHDAQSSYNGLQLKLQQRMARGFLFLAGYTWSKSIDDGKGEGGVFQNAYDRKGDKGPSDWDMRQRFVFSSTYELPFGKGKPFASNARGLVSKLVDGWSVSPILQVSTGLPFTPTLATPVANVGTFGTRPNRIGSGVLSNRTPDRWFDPTAFVAPPPFTFGNSGRNILYGPGTQQIDVNFQKSTYFSQDQRRYLQFRVECFNLTNTPQFNNPNSAIGAPIVGTIAAAGDPANFSRTSRQIQLALKFYF